MSELFSEIVEVQNTGNEVTIKLDANATTGTFGGPTHAGRLIVLDAANNEVFRVDGGGAGLRLGTTGNEGNLIVRDNQNREVFRVDGGGAVLRLGTTGNEGDLIVRDDQNREVFNFDGGNAVLRIGNTGSEGDLIVRDVQNREVFHVDGGNAVLRVGAAGNEGDIIVRNNAGTEVIHLNGGSGDIILNNADCAEDFDICNAMQVEPGTVMVLGEDGKLHQSQTAYDKRVAGVISGAGGYKPGIVLDKLQSRSDRKPIALLGKVFCKADAQYGAIEVGDLLTTAPTPGHAMKADDPLQAFGAVIGKALRRLEEGQALIPILIALQ